jgi:hypothetical protein
MTDPAILLTVAKFLAVIGYREDQDGFHYDSTGCNRVLLEETAEGNISLTYSSLIVGGWYPMGSFATEPYSRDFWENMAIAGSMGLRRGDIGIRLPLSVDTFLLANPEAAIFNQHRDKPQIIIPKAPINPGKAQKPGVTGTVVSKSKAKTKKDLTDEPDILDS